MFLPVPPAYDARPDLFLGANRKFREPTTSSQRWRHSKEIAIVACLVVIAFGGGVTWFFLVEERNEFLSCDLGSNSVRFGTLVNETQKTIEERHGKPERIWEEYHPLDSNIPEELPNGRIKTLLFHGREGLDNVEGTVMVWLVERRRGWVCFESVWFRENVFFP